MMWGYYPGVGWWMILSSVFWLVLIGVAIWALVVLARWVGRQTSTRTDHPMGGPPVGPAAGPSAEEIVRQRYARGEIDAATYEQMRERLDSPPMRHPAGAL